MAKKKHQSKVEFVWPIANVHGKVAEGKMTCCNSKGNVYISNIGTRNLETHPLSEDEVQARNLFALRAKQRAMIMADESLYDEYFALYQAAVKTGKADGYTFGEWLMTIRIDSSIVGD